MSDILRRILETKRAEVREQRASVADGEMARRARAAPPVRDFEGALRAAIADRRPAIIAESKRASPSKGLLREPYDPAAIARSYAAGGASCLSVLTDRRYFQGAPEHLVAARAACSLPVLRKDFLIDPYQVQEARALGADCVLLIAAALEAGAMRELEAAALELGMSVLVEVHDEEELEAALGLRTRLLGINNRDLRTFETRLERTIDLAPRVSAEHVLVSESGIATRQDVRRLREQGIGAFLVGEAFMRVADPGLALRALFFETK